MLSGEATNTNFIVFGLTRPDRSSRLISIEHVIKLHNKMAGQSQEQKAWILEDFTKSQSIFLDYFTLNQSQYVRYD